MSKLVNAILDLRATGKSNVVITTHRLLNERQAYLRYVSWEQTLSINYIEGGAKTLSDGYNYPQMKTDMKLHTRSTAWLPIVRDLFDDTWFIFELVDTGVVDES